MVDLRVDPGISWCLDWHLGIGARRECFLRAAGATGEGSLAVGVSTALISLNFG